MNRIKKDHFQFHERVQGLATKLGLCIQVENEHYFVVYFDCVTAFKMQYL